ncbi:Phosphotransferase enzyme family protein [Sphingopyxis sp. YR583]|nr:Phosphotransferase enzyme family protein [Sphingopyxis sp. YR583]
MVDEQAKLEIIRQEFERDARDMPAVYTLDEVPAFYECITAEWLTALVRTRYPSAEVSSFRLGERDSGTTNRRRIFLEYKGGDDLREFPASIFCKAAQDLANRITMSAGSAKGEVHFYNELRPKLEIDAPQCYFAAVDEPSYRAIIVLEDMGADVEFCSFRSNITRPRIESQLDVLARMHARFYGESKANPLLASLDSWQDRFTRIDQYHGLAEACRRGLLAAGEAAPASLRTRIDEIWPRTLQSVSRMDDLPQTLTHGDDHLGNWYLRSNDRMGLTDFQNANLGHWSRDVAYAISTSLTVADRRNWESELLAFYLDRLVAYGGGAEGFEESWRNYRQQLLSVLAWWTVTLTPSATMVQEMQPEDATLCFIERISQAVEDVDSLGSFD